MTLSTEAVGRTFAPSIYAVGREKIREYAQVVGETDPLYLDPVAARAAGYADVVAPPMFAVVYASPSIMAALLHPDLAIDFAMLVHGGQEFEWGPLVVAGDEVSTVVSVADISQRADKGFYVLHSSSCNQRGEQVCRGTWTNIVRGL